MIGNVDVDFSLVRPSIWRGKVCFVRCCPAYISSVLFKEGQINKAALFLIQAFLHAFPMISAFLLCLLWYVGILRGALAIF